MEIVVCNCLQIGQGEVICCLVKGYYILSFAFIFDKSIYSLLSGKELMPKVFDVYSVCMVPYGFLHMGFVKLVYVNPVMGCCGCNEISDYFSCSIGFFLRYPISGLSF